MRSRTLEFLSMLVTAMVVIDASWITFLMTSSTFFPDMFDAYLAPVVRTLGNWALAFKFATVIVFSVWIYRAGTNLAASHDGLEFTPGSRIWWFAIPIANLFKPFQAMRELWNASHGETDYAAGNGIVSAWWALWLLNSLASALVLINQRGDPAPALWFFAATMVARAVFAIMLVRGITRAQARMSGTQLSEVFA